MFPSAVCPLTFKTHSKAHTCMPVGKARHANVFEVKPKWCEVPACLAVLISVTHNIHLSGLVAFCKHFLIKAVLKKISGYIQEQNEKIYAPRGLLLTDPIERGMRVLEISVFEDRGSGSSSPSSSMSSEESSAR
ncbi:hypothetical protein PAMA_002446 [Pampus argenteus]